MALARSRGLTLALGVGLLTGACVGDQPIEQPTPLFGDATVEYPLELWDAGIEGETVLRVLVSESGEVEDVEILESSGVARLDSAAVVGARKLRFTPARRGDKRISVWAEVPVQFTTNPNARRNPGGGV
jgi:TonB family protein